VSCYTALLADAVCAELNAGTFCQAFTAVRLWLVEWRLPELATLRVSVVPGPLTSEILTRGRDLKTRLIDVAVQKRIGVDGDGNALTAEIDALVELVEEFVAFFRSRTISPDGPAAVCMSRKLITADQAAVAKEHLEDLRTFTGVLRLNFQVQGQS